MNYHLMVISRVETNHDDRIVMMTLYPGQVACIKPRAYEKVAASYIRFFQPGIELAESVSGKGKSRLKVTLHRPMNTEDERRLLGTTYYNALFGSPHSNDETEKGMADILYQMMRKLYAADASSEEAWTQACNEAVETLADVVRRHAQGK
jgi:hypothetical protein